MNSLKEQREQLIQAKMREMANIGVTKRTASNIPDFDDPIDLDDERMEANTSHVEVEGYTRMPLTRRQPLQLQITQRINLRNESGTAKARLILYL